MRPLSLAIDNLRRNKLLALATLFIMSVMLFIFNVIFTVNLAARSALNGVQAKIDLIVYIKDDADPVAVNQWIDDLKTLPETVSVKHTTKEEALQSMLADYKDDMNPFETYDLENPLPASLQITTKRPEDQTNILTFLQQPKYQPFLLNVESEEENRQISENLLTVTRFTKKILFGMVLAFVLGSLLVIANAIHLTILHRRKEIEIMRLVGARWGLIRSPFLIEGALYGIASVVIGAVLLFIFGATLNLEEFGLLTFNLPYLQLFGIEILAGIVLGIASSWGALDIYLKKA